MNEPLATATVDRWS